MIEKTLNHELAIIFGNHSRLVMSSSLSSIYITYYIISRDRSRKINLEKKKSN